MSDISALIAGLSLTTLLFSALIPLMFALIFPRFFGVIMVIQGLLYLFTIIGVVIGVIEIIVGFLFIRWGRSRIYGKLKKKLIKLEEKMSKTNNERKLKQLEHEHYKLRMKLAKFEK
ncbi:hypothetical protein H17ap60334_04787 [Thermosipho africanus H17ap60334]|jgi:uncharacterized membrane protein (DUF106 family)|uniref:DUF5362 family protein n=1 Tax=Thermosipho africanus TaxID=2421 RepID=UPI00028D851E|nr:DUF5362 family protein [Thermosipho africanus]EKF49499.1 hypothetical protein H17ap60334_04787 [Thermosipho africanus H17ap60334]